jgi:hypothetical protein
MQRSASGRSKIPRRSAKLTSAPHACHICAFGCHHPYANTNVMTTTITAPAKTVSVLVDKGTPLETSIGRIAPASLLWSDRADTETTRDRNRLSSPQQPQHNRSHVPLLNNRKESGKMAPSPLEEHMSEHQPLSPERLAEIRERLAAIDGPWSPILEAEDYVQVWRTAALRDVHHDADGRMIAWSAPGSYKPTDLVAEWDLDDANEGDDDLRDRRAWFIAHAPDDIAALLTEVEELRAKLALFRDPHEPHPGGACMDCASTWPCRTARIVDGGEK